MSGRQQPQQAGGVSHPDKDAENNRSENSRTCYAPPMLRNSFTEAFAGDIMDWEQGTRGTVNAIVTSNPVQAFMGLVIFLNAFQVIYECDVNSKCLHQRVQSACEQEDGWLKVMNWIYLFLYSIELGMRIFVHRSACLGNSWDVFDSVIIFVGIISELFSGQLPSTGILRLFRLVRLIKAIKIFKLSPELAIFIFGFLSAMKAIFMGAILMIIMLLLWAVVAMEGFNDLNHGEHMDAVYQQAGCSECYKAWSSVPEALLTLTRLSLFGDGYSQAMLFVREYPWAIIVFASVYFTVVLGMANLVLAVIVEKALQAHEADVHEDARLKNMAKKEAGWKFMDLCKAIDEDGGGTLTIDELLQGYDSYKLFRDTLSIMDISKDDLVHVFKFMDQEEVGEVSYEQFSQQLVSINSQELQTMVSFIKHWVHDVKVDVEKMRRHMFANEVSPRSLSRANKKSSRLSRIDQNPSRLGVGTIRRSQTLPSTLKELEVGCDSTAEAAVETPTLAAEDVHTQFEHEITPPSGADVAQRAHATRLKSEVPNEHVVDISCVLQDETPDESQLQLEGQAIVSFQAAMQSQLQLFKAALERQAEAVEQSARLSADLISSLSTVGLELQAADDKRSWQV